MAFRRFFSVVSCFLLFFCIVSMEGIVQASEPQVPTRSQSQIGQVLPTGQPAAPIQPGSDLITPINADPITIDQALERRLSEIKKPARNAILLIVDGMGATAIKLAREVLVGREGLLEIDKMPVTARMIGNPSDGPVNDSAAAASELSTGHPIAIHKLCMSAEGRPIKTLWEHAKSEGFRVGLISDTRLTHATPAGFATHMNGRDDEDALAPQMIDSGFEILLSGGRKAFAPRKTASATEQLDPLAVARQRGYSVALTRDEFKDAVSQRNDKVLGLFSDSFMSFSYEAGKKSEPTLAEMTAGALILLSRGQERFLLMVEAGKIDATLHSHDPAELVQQMSVMEETLKVLRDYVNQHPDTLLVITSDHSTGGLILTENFDPVAFKNLATSTNALSWYLKDKGDGIPAIMKKLFPTMPFTDIELQDLIVRSKGPEFNAAIGSLFYSKLGLLFLPMEQQLSLKITHGHTGEDLFIHAQGAHQNLFSGTMRIWDIPRRMAAAMGLSFP
ncbi:MAG: alkaline phosphatase [Candidatus Ozemobacteraceae bacterium]